KVTLGSNEWTSLLAEWPQLQRLEVEAIAASLSGGEVRVLLPDESSVRIVAAEFATETAIEAAMND
ncbi:MAG: hypothetical protein K8J08_18260, partial [Thermoanaerobaculia bacterium]|nr:hypothetical protein [Thermoanaerobaculia bacterium]